jgi:flagellin-specific chaperone FliS
VSLVFLMQAQSWEEQQRLSMLYEEERKSNLEAKGILEQMRSENKALKVHRVQA